MGLAAFISALAGFAGARLDLFNESERDRSWRDYVSIGSDFTTTAGGSLPAPWGTQDTSAAGTPTLDFVANGINGQFVLKLDTTNEVEKITLYFADYLPVSIGTVGGLYGSQSSPYIGPIFECRLKIEPDVTGGGDAFAAGDMLVIGLGTARNATLSSMTKYAWFKTGLGSKNWLSETKDGTTTKTAGVTGAAFVSNTYVDLRIDASDLTDVKFYINGVRLQTANYHNLSGLATTDKLQIFCELQKAAAANFDHRVTVDYAHVIWPRT